MIRSKSVGGSNIRKIWGGELSPFKSSHSPPPKKTFHYYYDVNIFHIVLEFEKKFSPPPSRNLK